MMGQVRDEVSAAHGEGCVTRVSSEALAQDLGPGTPTPK